MKKIDLTKLKKRTNFDIERSNEYFFSPNFLENTNLKKECCFIFNKSDISSRIIYRVVARKATSLDITVILSSTEKSIQNVEVFLEIYVLNLSKDNSVIVKPFLEIPQKDIKFEHKVTIGTPNDTWIKYLQSRGLSYNQALELISESFITGQ